MEGTKILCYVDREELYLPIETLKAGMLVVTRGGYKKIDMIGSSTHVNPSAKDASIDTLYICKKANYPELTEDLILTGTHSILVNRLSEDQKHLIKKIKQNIFITENKYRLIACIDPRAEPYPVQGAFTMWNMALENKDDLINYGIYANGLLVETASKRAMVSKQDGE